MRYRIKRFGVQSTAVVVSVIYFVLALVFAPLFYLLGRNAPGGGAFPAIIMVIAPIGYGIVGYLFTAISCWLYNIVASWTGGIELTLEPGEAGGA